MVVINAVASNLSSSTKLPPGVDFGDLVSWGVEGILKARKKYNPKKGAQFKTYANFRIRGEILDNIRREWAHRSPNGYKKHKEKIAEKIAEYVEGEISDTKTKKTVDSLIQRSAVAYMLSLDDGPSDAISGNIEDKTQNLDEALQKEEDKSIIWAEVSSLDDYERDIIVKFYKENKSQKDIALELNMSRSRICRLHSKILDKLKRRLERELEGS